MVGFPMCFRYLFHSLLTVMCMASIAVSATLENGVLLVDGKPFFPLGGWDEQETTPADIARLGMNTSFRHGAPTNPEMEVKFRKMMRESAAHGIQVMPYLSYGGHGVNPWPAESVRFVSRIADEPNLLAWYVGDDIAMRHLEGLRQTVTVLREGSPDIPTVADYIESESAEAKAVFTEYVDVRANYDYPLPSQTFTAHQRFFERQRAFVGDPLWTWVQSFMWGRTGRDHGVQLEEGPAPIPDAEQVRLLSFAAVNRGVRGLLYFSHREIVRLPGVASMVALTCQEIRLFSEYLAAGTPTYHLKSSHPNIDASAFTYQGSVVLSAALFKSTYHRWVDEGVVENVTIDCPWPANAPLPQAVLVATPDVMSCGVARVGTSGMIRVTVPSLELAGFILVSTDVGEVRRIRNGVGAIPSTLLTLVSPGAVAQTQKVASMIWKMGFDRGGRSPHILAMMRASEACILATTEGRPVEAVVAWKRTLRIARSIVDHAMHTAEVRRYNIPAQQQAYLHSPWGLHSIPNLRDVPEETPWQVVREWRIAGPFPLNWDGKSDSGVSPPGLVRKHPPEGPFNPDTKFDTVDGRARWQKMEGDISGVLDLLPAFATTDNMVAYARCRIIAPRDMDVTLSLGSNDGAKMLVNGESEYEWHGGRWATPHQEMIPVRLKAGPNTVLVKVENLKGGWRLFLAVHDARKELQIDID
jgi:hypothetical protein